jgi:hypothetical protein
MSTSGFYIDVTETLQAGITSGVSQAAASRAGIEQAKGVLRLPTASSRTEHSTSWSGAHKKPTSRYENSPTDSWPQ